MTHELEIINGKASIAYAGEMPWHGLGVKVSNDLSPIEMLQAAGLDWTVKKYRTFSVVDKKPIICPVSSLIRSSDNKLIDMVSEDWVPVQNQVAFEFFDEFVKSGDMEMHTAGSLKGGQIVWCLAKIKNSFELFGGDLTECYLLFTNYHRYGFSTDIRVTLIRVVCANTIAMALSSSAQKKFKYSHRKSFNPEYAKEVLGIASDTIKDYKEKMSYLGSKKTKDETIVEYFTRLFPGSITPREADSLSRNAKNAIARVSTQPGKQFAEGTWYQPYQVVTRIMDHEVGRSPDTRLASSWYGEHQKTKLKALSLALEMAEKA